MANGGELVVKIAWGNDGVDVMVASLLVPTAFAGSLHIHNVYIMHMHVQSRQHASWLTGEKE
jgi:hypothetical protein